MSTLSLRTWSRTVPVVASKPTAAIHAMQCMEVWGGNGVSENGVTMPGLDAWVLSRPYAGDDAGGDIHYVSSCGTGRISRLLVADVSGHGTEVSGLAVTLRNLMRRYVNYVDQTQFFSKLNAEFATSAKVGMFATAIVATYWAPTDCFVFSNAGHPRPLAYSSKRGQWFTLSQEEFARPDAEDGPSNLPLGIIDESKYEQFAVRARAGDLIVIYTDSLIEAKRRDGSMLGTEGLLNVVRDLDASKPGELAVAILDSVIRECDGLPPDDDVTILVLRPNDLKPRQTIPEKFTSIGRFFGMMLSSVRSGAPPVPWPEARLENLLGPLVPSVNARWQRKAKELGD